MIIGSQKIWIAVIICYLGLPILGVIIFLISLILKLNNILANIDWFWIWFPLWIVPVLNFVLLLIGILYWLFGIVIPTVKESEEEEKHNGT